MRARASSTCSNCYSSRSEPTLSTRGAGTCSCTCVTKRSNSLRGGEGRGLGLEQGRGRHPEQVIAWARSRQSTSTRRPRSDDIAGESASTLAAA